MAQYGPEGSSGESAEDPSGKTPKKDEAAAAEGEEGDGSPLEPADNWQFCRTKLEDMTHLLIDWQYIESLDKEMPPLATNGQGRIFTQHVQDIVHHPERPRKLLHGTTPPDEAIGEFVSAAVLKLQHLAAAPPLPEEEISDDFIRQDLFSELHRYQIPWIQWIAELLSVQAITPN